MRTRTATIFLIKTLALGGGDCGTLPAQPVPTISPPHAGTPDSSRIARVDKLFETWDKPTSPGCALGIVQDGKLIYEHGYGMANLDYHVPITAQSAFEISSMVKQFTGMSILLLARQGKLALDDDVRTYLPALPRYQHPVTIGHLIYHTSGIRSQYGLMSYSGMASVDLTDDDVLGLIALQKRLNFEPGDEYKYTDTAYFLLGMIVEKVSGLSMHAFAEENIFKPLGMTSTQLEVDRTATFDHKATPYITGRTGTFAAYLTHNFGEMITSVDDLFLWDQNFYHNTLGGGPDLIRQELASGVLNNGDSIGYAVGLGIGDYRGLQEIGWGGGGPGAHSFMARYPAQKFSVIVLCNAEGADVSRLVGQVSDIFLADKFSQGVAVDQVAAVPPSVAAVPEKDLADLAGTYVESATAGINRFYVKDGGLMLANGTGYVVLSPLGQNRFKLSRPTREAVVVFSRSVDDGHMQAMFTRQGGAYPTRTYDAVHRIELSQAKLAQFIGRYISDELAGATYSVSGKEGKLLLQLSAPGKTLAHRGQVLATTQHEGSDGPATMVLTSAFADAFLTDDGVLVTFTRNARNAVSGFALTQGSIRGLRFDRREE